MACRVTKAGIKPCKGLAAVVQSPYERGSRRQGVAIHHMVSMKTGDFTRDLVVLKSGDHGKKGIVMNNCPFCAKPLLKEARP